MSVKFVPSLPNVAGASVVGLVGGFISYASRCCESPITLVDNHCGKPPFARS